MTNSKEGIVNRNSPPPSAFLIQSSSLFVIRPYGLVFGVKAGALPSHDVDPRGWPDDIDRYVRSIQMEKGKPDEGFGVCKTPPFRR